MATEGNSDAQSTTEMSKAEAAAMLSSYLGISFAVFLAFLPASSISYAASLQSRNRILTLRLFAAEDELRKVRSSRMEDSRANARVAEIVAGHRHAWQKEEKRLVAAIRAAENRENELRTAVERLEKDLAVRDEMIDLMRRERERDQGCFGNFAADSGNFACGEDLPDFGKLGGTEKISGRELAEGRGYFRDLAVPRSEDMRGGRGHFGDYATSEKALGEDFRRREAELGGEYLVDVRGRVGNSLAQEDFLDGDGYFGDSRAPVKVGPESPVRRPLLSESYFFEKNGKLDDLAAFYGQKQQQQQQYFGSHFLGGWQGTRYESTESAHSMKGSLARRECPWKVDGESAGVSSKLKLLEQELINLEKVGKGDLCKVSSLLRKQAKRYQSLSGKIYDLCKRMQVSDPSEQALSREFRTQRQTEFLFEALHLQHRATEIGQKLTNLQVESATTHFGDEVVGEAKNNTKKAMDSIRNNFKEIQRNLEIWLARIMGDLEGILARDGALRARDYYMSRYPSVR